MSLTKTLKPLMVLVALGFFAGCASMFGGGEEERVPPEQREQLQKRFNEAVALMESGQEDSARELLLTLHQEQPRATGPLANLGIIAARQERNEEAEAYFRQVLAQDQGHVGALNQLGILARKRGDFEQAESFYRQALDRQRDFQPALLNLAILKDIYMAEPGEAVALYERYQKIADQPVPQLEDWIFDARNRAGDR